MRNELELETRFPLLLAIVAVITAAKLLGSLVIEPWRERRALSPHAEHPRITAAKTRVHELVHALRDGLRRRLSDPHHALRARRAR